MELWRRNRLIKLRRLLMFLSGLGVFASVAALIILAGVGGATFGFVRIPRLLWMSPLLCGALFVTLLVLDRRSRRISQCQQCGFFLGEQLPECPRCTAPLLHCVACGYELFPGAERCAECGAGWVRNETGPDA